MAVVGENPDINAIQESIASYLGIQLKDQAKQVRVDKLRQGFEAKLKGGENKFLIILDDVWKPVDLEDIGLSLLPNHGVNFKVLLTSQNKDVCTEMGVKADSVLNVGLLTEANVEAQSFFLQLWEPYDDVDHELHKIGEEIVKKCCGLPIAIKTMACTLRSKNKDTWKSALSCLQHHDISTVVPTVFQTSYDNIQDEVTGDTFLLCGLFLEDFDIPTEDLLKEARYQLNVCIERLMHTNLLIESDVVGCVKLHDLRASLAWRTPASPAWPSLASPAGDSPAGLARRSLAWHSLAMEEELSLDSLPQVVQPPLDFPMAQPPLYSGRVAQPPPAAAIHHH
ncbi:unnamed protein product [Lactuca saligna]|uniref:NB-ARC domain-containing protein n=1 Tax=Lactuca saligna TaxID=75948 RepID=A0AA35Y7M6_LACSI|nr:unnamed protein product [Lactuca saligna]